MARPEVVDPLAEQLERLALVNADDGHVAHCLDRGDRDPPEDVAGAVDTGM
jgi:hypothetical protein